METISAGKTIELLRGDRVISAVAPGQILEEGDRLHVNPMHFIICIMIGASASFATPIGYQTNMMVYGPGGYRFRDYFRFGVPLNIALGIMTVTLAPFIWPF